MNLGQFLPELILAGFALAVVLLDLALQRKGLLAVVSLVGLAISAGFAAAMWGDVPRPIFNGMLATDGFAVFFKLLFLGVAALVILASRDYVHRLKRFQGEYYALILLSTLGMMLMAATTNLIAIYVALELASISLYALVGFLKDSRSTEASLKYLLLGAIASAVLLYGMALVFGTTGTVELEQIVRVLPFVTGEGIASSPALVLGVVLMIAGFGFKIAAVPFHMWVPDVYEGAPTPITAYLSVASKAAGFAVILRVFDTAFLSPPWVLLSGMDIFWLSTGWGLVFAILAAIGMTLGNVMALPQTNIKRMLGYSSIAQAGYLLVGVAAMGAAGVSGITEQSGVVFFLATYALANLGAFTAIIAISNKVNSDSIRDYTGMAKRAPLLALALTLCLISLIGMPPAAGFMAKFYIFSGAVQQGLLWLVIIAVLNSVISAYYYLRVVKVMWFGEPASSEKVPASIALRLALFLTCSGVLLFGIVPGLLMKAAENARIFGF